MEKENGSNKTPLTFGGENNLKSLDSYIRFLIKTGYVKNCVFDGEKGFIVEINEDEKKFLKHYQIEGSK